MFLIYAVQTLLFTVVENDSQEPDVTETELALELLEKAIYTSLRRSDVSTRYSSKQMIVILMDANGENGDMVAGRIRFYSGVPGKTACSQHQGLSPQQHICIVCHHCLLSPDNRAGFSARARSFF